MTGRRAVAPFEWEVHLREAGVDGALCGRLAIYLGMLWRFGEAVDLVGPAAPERAIAEHVVEALAAVPLLAEAGSLVDIGSGAGLPGVPLLVALSGWQGTLLEPRERRWAFLREVVRELGLNCVVQRGRVTDLSGSFDAVTVRALAVGAWGGEAARLLNASGRLCWWTTEEKPEAAGVRDLELVVTSPLPARGRGNIVVFRRCST